MSPTPASRPPHVFLSCGEASGDRYGAALVAALRRRRPDLRVTALGGAALAAAGAQVVEPAEPLAVMGFGEVLGALPRILAARRRLWRHLATAGVDICVPVDFPGFNLRLAARARALGVPVFYLVAPQLWAWGAWRLGGLRRAVDRVGVILPFEAAWFGARGIAAVPIGHPLVEEYGAAGIAAAAVARESRLRDAKAPLTLGLLPGSRRQELARLLPEMLGADHLLRRALAPRPLRCVVSAAPGREAAVRAAVAGSGAEVSSQPLPRLLPTLDLALVCSGTASLEAALAGVPHQIVYRTSPLNYVIARRLVRVRWIGLANLVLGESLVPEQIQGGARASALASGLAVWIEDPARRAAFAAGVARLRGRLGGPGVWDRAADAVLSLLAERSGVAGGGG